MPTIMPFSDSAALDEIISSNAAASQLEEGFAHSEFRHAPRNPARYRYLLPDLLRDPRARLPVNARTVVALKELGNSMQETGTDPTFASTIPSAYTYFGQFVDHDITSMALPVKVNLNDPNLVPLTPAEMDNIRNVRIPTLDLDSVYADAPYVGDDLLLLGAVTKPAGPRPPGKIGDDFDLPRSGRSSDPAHDRVARIGDPRNDENAIVAQLHVAFLRAHNAIVKRGLNRDEARSLLRKYYHSIIAHDFLNRVADPAIVSNMLAKPWKFFDPSDNNLFMPLEFTVAAFRFGHSMVRGAYNFNDHFTERFAPLLRLFNVLGRYRTLPEQWIIQWENFVEGGSNRARQIDTRLVSPLFIIPGLPLAVTSLLRGYILGLPTGQALANALGLAVMSEEEIQRVAAENPRQLNALREGGFLDRTPLWFYILAEAEHDSKGRLGPLGSTLVAGVLVALIRRSKDSFMKVPGWSPASSPKFKLPDLLRLAEVL
jgi:hypothetical protein